MFAVVEFKSPTPSIAVAHKSWIFANKCYWPPWKDTIKTNAAIRKGTIPDPTTWPIYDIHVVGGRFFSTYEEARSKLNLPQEQIDASDLSAAEDQSKLRKRPVIREYDSDCEDEQQNTSMPETPRSSKKIKKYSAKPNIALPPAPPAFPSYSGNTIGHPRLVAVADMNKADTNFGSQMSHNMPPALPQIPVPMALGLPSVSTADSHQNSFRVFGTFGNGPNYTINEQYSANGVPEAISSNNVPGFESSGTEEYPMGTTITYNIPSSTDQSFVKHSDIRATSETAGLIKGLQLQVEVLGSKLDLAMDMLRTIVHGRNFKNSTAEVLDLSGFTFPLTSLDDIDKLENQIKDLQTRNILVDLISTRGGDNVNQITYRIVSWLLSDEMQCEFSIAGKKNKAGLQKRCFRGTRLFNSICDGVKKQPKGSVANDKEIEKAVEYWLKRAPQRLGKQKGLQAPQNSQEEEDD